MVATGRRGPIRSRVVSELLEPFAFDSRPGLMPEGAELETDPEAIVLLAAALLAARRIGAAGEMVRHLDAVTAGRRDGQQWRGRMEFVWAVHAERTADVPAVLGRCRAAAQLLGDSLDLGSSQPLDAVIAENFPVLSARAHIRLGELDHAREVLEQHFGTQARAELVQPAVAAMLACAEGRLSDAFSLATAALPEEQYGPDLGDLDARLVRAKVFRERNQLDDAERELEMAVHLCGSAAALEWMWVAEADLVRVTLAQGRAGEALNHLYWLRKATGPGVPHHPALRALGELEADCLLRLGDVEGAVRVARMSPASGFSSETLARIDLRAGRPDHALNRLRGPASPDLAVQIRKLVLSACAEMQHGRREQAEQIMRRAVEAGRLEHYVRPFLENGREALSLLQILAGSVDDLYLSQLVSQTDPLLPSALVSAPLVVEPLTDRERQILRYLPSHLSQHQIATVMFVSRNTVKTHLKAIYRKIGATSRHDAVSIARSHGLL